MATAAGTACLHKVGHSKDFHWFKTWQEMFFEGVGKGAAVALFVPPRSARTNRCLCTFGWVSARWSQPRQLGRAEVSFDPISTGVLTSLCSGSRCLSSRVELCHLSTCGCEGQTQWAGPPLPPDLPTPGKLPLPREVETEDRRIQVTGSAIAFPSVCMSGETQPVLPTLLQSYCVSRGCSWLVPLCGA